MDARDAARPRALQEIVEQHLADAAALMVGRDGEQQQFGFVGDRAEQREADRLAALGSRASISQTPGIGRMPAHLRAGPGLAEAVAEGRSMTAITASMSSGVPGSMPDSLAQRRGRHHAASRTRASGARA